MTRKSIALIVGARPNFMKAAPLWKALKESDDFDVELIHTGQHFDKNMSEVFFDQLGLPKPDSYLDVHTDKPPSQIAQIILALSTQFSKNHPDLIVVFGDVNSTLAAAIAANKMNLPLAHVEAGLRSFDRSMPEEHNRVATDMLSDLLFTPSVEADENLLREGVAKDRIHRVGNIMVDSLLAFKAKAEKAGTTERLGVNKQDFALVTLHRQSNVDQPKTLREILSALADIAERMPVIFPIHPRTKKNVEALPLDHKSKGISFIEPLSYLDFMNLMINARVVLTDSGGIQEETTVLGVKCLTLRENTERPITLTLGTNKLVGNTREGIVKGFEEAMGKTSSTKRIPDLWDGKTAGRVAAIIRAYLI